MLDIFKEFDVHKLIVVVFKIADIFAKMFPHTVLVLTNGHLFLQL